jgi:hypothetical protein
MTGGLKMRMIVLCYSANWNSRYRLFIPHFLGWRSYGKENGDSKMDPVGERFIKKCRQSTAGKSNDFGCARVMHFLQDVSPIHRVPTPPPP